MAYARIQIAETASAVAPSSIEVGSDPLDDDATVERVVRNLAILWMTVVVGES